MSEYLNNATLMILCVLNNLENSESCYNVTTVTKSAVTELQMLCSSVTAELDNILCTLRSQDISQTIRKMLSSVTGDSIKHETSWMFSVWSIPSGAEKTGTFKILI